MKNLLSENMLRFGTKNLTEAAKKELVINSIMETIDQHDLNQVILKKLSEQVVDPLKAKGTAMKIVGMLMVALSGINSDEPKVLQALRLIKPGGGKICYDEVIKIIRTSPKVKQQFGKNFKLVSDLIKGGGIADPGNVSQGTDYQPTHNPFANLGWGITDEEWTVKYEAILNVYNPEEEF
jgi:hypothetical protein